MGALSDRFKILLLRLEDWARVNKLSSAFALVRLASKWRAGGAVTSVAIANYLVAAHPAPFRRNLVRKAVSAAASEPLSDEASCTLSRCIVVKSPVSDAERGVLIVSFEGELDKLTRHRAFPDIERRYQIAFLPTWQPAYSGPLFALAARATRPYVIMPALPEDLNLASELGPLCVPLPFQASSWIAPGEFPAGGTKDIDLLMVANFSKYKRHWRLFEGLAQVPDRWTVVLAGRPWEGRTAETLREEARLFGVVDRFEIRQDPGDQEISDLMARARLFCGLSHKEGSYIAVAEAMMAGTPVALYRDAIIGSKAFVNERTGFLLDPRRALGPQLRESIEKAKALNARGWAEKNVAAEANVARLDELLHAQAVKRGEPWTAPIAGFHCRNFNFAYFDADAPARFADDYRRLERDCGLHLAGW